MTLTVHRARWIMVEPEHWIENGVLVMLGNRIQEVHNNIPKSVDGPVMDHGNGVLMPTLVNAHTHISLSGHARSRTSEGFTKWVEALIAERNRQPCEEAVRTVQDGAKALKDSGTGLVGEFGPHIPVAMTLKTFGIEATVWLESLGNDRELPSLPQSIPSVHHAYGGHAPHTTSPALLKRIQKADLSLGQRFCFHLAESKEESEFLRERKGVWADFMTRMGIDFKAWEVFGKRPVEMALDTGLLTRNTMAVHLLEINAGEMAALAQTGAHVCLCPRSNWHLHRKLPDIEGFIKLGVQPALGTDSLASAPSLSLFDEMLFIHDRYPNLRPEIILGMGTRNGAQAMGYPELGTLKPGSRGPVIHVELDAPGPRQVAEALVSTENLMLRPVL
jgi:cytosine/adenosine deaminase-related metal-dependent hydrolase